MEARVDRAASHLARVAMTALAIVVATAATATAPACGRSSAPRQTDDSRERRAGATAGAPAAPGAAASGAAAPTATPPGTPDTPGTPAGAGADGTYQGRPIAPTCSYLGAGWLDRPDRAEREQPDRVLDALHLGPRDTVADVGAGTGYFTLRLAARVAKVHATDVQREMLDILTSRIAKQGLRNVELHLATERDAALPERCCDLALLVDVYHELADPTAVMAGIRRALTERGRLVLVEYRGEDPSVPILPEHKMTLPRIQHELAGLGFRFVESLEFLPDQRIVIFTPDGTR
jgi:Methyltransferase domain